MKLCRFIRKNAAGTTPLPTPDNPACIGLATASEQIIDLDPARIRRIHQVLQHPTPGDFLNTLDLDALPRNDLNTVALLPPIDRQEVWAAGVTYFRSKTARMEESDFSATAYDKVYEASRPELFFKSLPEKVVGPNAPVGIRQDAAWNVPEPELAFILNAAGTIAGFTIGNDMSSRDIEGENLLYLPQAKIYDKSCALGPWILLGATEAKARQWEIRIAIQRNETTVFSGATNINQIKRPFAELAGYLCRSQTFPQGAVLLTGTGIVPGDNFTLQANDKITIAISGIGTLTNTVCSV